MVEQFNGITIGFGWTLERCNEFLNPYHHNNSLLTKELYLAIGYSLHTEIELIPEGVIFPR